jgi:hypothetical protein
MTDVEAISAIAKGTPFGEELYRKYKIASQFEQMQRAHPYQPLYVTKILKEAVPDGQEQAVREQFEELKGQMLEKLQLFVADNDIVIEDDDLQQLAQILTELAVFDDKKEVSTKSVKKTYSRPITASDQIQQMALELIRKSSGQMDISCARNEKRKVHPDIAQTENEVYRNAIYAPWLRSQQQEVKKIAPLTPPGSIAEPTATGSVTPVQVHPNGSAKAEIERLALLEIARDSTLDISSARAKVRASRLDLRQAEKIEESQSAIQIGNQG